MAGLSPDEIALSLDSTRMRLAATALAMGVRAAEQRSVPPLRDTEASRRARKHNRERTARTTEPVPCDDEDTEPLTDAEMDARGIPVSVRSIYRRTH